MADENQVETAVTAPEAVALEPVSEPKKQRAPRGSKAVAKATAEATPVIKQPRKKREAKAVDAVSPSTATGKVAPTEARKGGRKSTAVVGASTTAAPAASEMTDLVLLEQENQELRQALAEKLRSENADLRKRLGL